MVAPLIYGAAYLGSIYYAGKLVDTARFWSDYRRNTGYSPKYPFIRGWGTGFSSGSSAFSNLKRF